MMQIIQNSSQHLSSWLSVSDAHFLFFKYLQLKLHLEHFRLSTKTQQAQNQIVKMENPKQTSKEETKLKNAK